MEVPVENDRCLLQQLWAASSQPGNHIRSGNIFTNDLEERGNGSLRKFADEVK